MPNKDHLEAIILQAMPIDYKCRFNEMKLKVRREKLLDELLKYCTLLETKTQTL